MSEKLGITVKKSDFSEWYSQLCQKAELSDIRYGVKGFIVIRQWGARIMKLMYDLYEAELERRGHYRTYFPALIPESNLKKEEEHIKGFIAETFWVESAGSDKEKLEEPLAMRPTSETAMYPMYSLWVRSWRDLPMKLYQSCQVWRYEGKATHPFIRGREFYWIEAHDVFSTKHDAEAQVIEDMEIAHEVMYKQYGVPFIFLRRPDWDKFAGAVYTCASDAIMPDGKLLQLPSTHFLGQRFAEAFNITFEDREGNKAYAWQTCYGPGISRILGAIIAIHGDDKGLVLPYRIAPVQIVIVPIFTADNRREILGYAKRVASKLKGYRVYVDSRTEYTPGWKYNEWEMKGVPLRIEVGPKEMKKKQVVLVRRDNGKKFSAKLNSINKLAKRMLEDIHNAMISKVDRILKNSTHSAKTYAELKSMLDKAGVVRVNFCSIDKDGEPCADKIKTELNADVKGIRHEIAEKPHGKCIICGRDARVIAYVGKSY